MAFKKGDIVRVDYNAYIADIERLYDTTSESAAKDAGIYITMLALNTSPG